jgi:hypothetical protein
MQHIGMTDMKFDVKQITYELETHPEIWNEIPYRTCFPNSPHREVDDVWVRYNALENYKGDGTAFNGPHESVWYPVIEKIPAARNLAFSLFKQLDGMQLGAVLVTRVPAGKRVYPHVDPGWHARYYDKWVIQVKGDAKQAFCFYGEALSANAGDCYWFDNAYEHWVINQSDQERISLIVCVRRGTCL